MPTILYIDDVLQALALRKSMLESHGYDVLTASDGISGIEMVNPMFSPLRRPLTNVPEAKQVAFVSA